MFTQSSFLFIHHNTFHRSQRFGFFVFIDADDPNEFLDSLREAGVRIMLNPQVISETHTKWKEVIRNGEQWKYVDAELN